jgi:hypothetical protein
MFRGVGFTPQDELMVSAGAARGAVDAGRSRAVLLPDASWFGAGDCRSIRAILHGVLCQHLAKIRWRDGIDEFPALKRGRSPKSRATRWRLPFLDRDGQTISHYVLPLPTDPPGCWSLREGKPAWIPDLPGCRWGSVLNVSSSDSLDRAAMAAYDSAARDIPAELIRAAQAGRPAEDVREWMVQRFSAERQRYPRELEFRAVRSARLRTALQGPLEMPLVEKTAGGEAQRYGRPPVQDRSPGEPST